MVTPDMKALGIGPDLVVGGRRLELAPLTMADWQMFSKWCRDRAWDRLDEQRNRRGEAWYAEQSAQLMRQLPSWDYMQAGFVADLNTLAGWTRVAWLSLQKRHRGQVTEEEVAEAMEERFHEILQKLAEANADHDAGEDEDGRPKAPASSGTPPGG